MMVVQRNTRGVDITHHPNAEDGEEAAREEATGEEEMRILVEGGERVM
jgi:hypothetical protein